MHLTLSSTTDGPLREIGTAYVGKEPQEHVVDVLRTVMRRTGGEVGFEACLSSRPFTVGPLGDDRLGGFQFGRASGTATERARTDMSHGLATLAELGWFTGIVDLADGIAAADEQDAVVLVGPVAVPGQLVPTADRVMCPDLARFLVVEQALAHDEVLCFDPVFAGLTTAAAGTLEPADAIVIRSPLQRVAAHRIAEECLSRGRSWRASDGHASDRDASYFAMLSDSSASLMSGTAALRLRFSLQALQIHSLRWATAIGALEWPGPGELATVDALHEQVIAARRALRALVSGDAGGLAGALDELADQAGLLTGLAAAQEASR